MQSRNSMKKKVVNNDDTNGYLPLSFKVQNL